MLNFRSVEFSDQALVNSYMSRYGGSSCQHSFVSLFTLSEKYGSKICEQDGFLYVLREKLCSPGKRVYLAPMGGGDLKAAYSTLLDDAAAHQCRAVFETVTYEQLTFLREHFPGRFCYTELRDYAEYIFSTKSLCAMAGRRFANKRNEIRSILRTYGDRLEYRLLTSADTDAVLSFSQKWLERNGSVHDAAALTLERKIMQKQLDHFDALSLQGMAIYLDGEMIAFAYGFPLNDQCFDGLVEKASYDIPNLYKLLNWKMSCLCAAPYPYYNWEEDVGFPGLRFAKMEYFPVLLLRKYVVSERSESASAPESDEIPVLSAVPPHPDEELLPRSFSPSADTVSPNL